MKKIFRSKTINQIVIVITVCMLITGCSVFNEPNTPCGIRDEFCLVTTPINQ